MAILESIRAWAQRIERDAITLWFAQRHPDTPLLARALCILAVAYALSPLDLIPDFIPVLGFVDEALLLPAFVWLAVRLLPPSVVDTCRIEADAWMAAKHARPRSYAGAAIVVAVWTSAAYLAWRWYAGPR